MPQSSVSAPALEAVKHALPACQLLPWPEHQLCKPARLARAVAQQTFYGCFSLNQMKMIINYKGSFDMTYS